MCLSIVGKIEKIEDGMAYMDLSGVMKWICIDLIEEPQIGDELLIHAGCAICKLNKLEAEETRAALRLFREGQVGCYGEND